MKCIRFFKYIFLLETGRELKETENPFHQFAVNYHLERLSGRKNDELKLYYNMKFKLDKNIQTRLNFSDEKLLARIENYELNNSLIENKEKKLM